MSNVAIRTALGDAYLGDTKKAKEVFGANPALFDLRLLGLLSGLGLTDPTLSNGAIEGDDLKAVMAALDPVDNAKRVAILGLLASTSRTVYDLNSVYTGSAPIAGFPSLSLSGIVDANSRVIVSRFLNFFSLDVSVQFKRPGLPSGSPIFNTASASLNIPSDSLPLSLWSGFGRGSAINSFSRSAADFDCVFGDSYIDLSFPDYTWEQAFASNSELCFRASITVPLS